jgi:predicted membrane channel-forming protein YqfA (hemolysin III family)
VGSSNKIVTYLLLTALMVLSFACAIVINNTAFGWLGWTGLFILNLGILVYLSRK